MATYWVLYDCKCQNLLESSRKSLPCWHPSEGNDSRFWIVGYNNTVHVVWSFFPFVLGGHQSLYNSYFMYCIYFFYCPTIQTGPMRILYLSIPAAWGLKPVFRWLFHVFDIRIAWHFPLDPQQWPTQEYSQHTFHIIPPQIYHSIHQFLHKFIAWGFVRWPRLYPMWGPASSYAINR